MGEAEEELVLYLPPPFSWQEQSRLTGRMDRLLMVELVAVVAVLEVV